MSRALVEEVATRLESVVGSSRTVYRHTAPASPATRYFLVASSDVVSADTLADLPRVHDDVVWVTSVSRNASPNTAADEAMWGREKAQGALLGWRPTTGDIAWKPQHLDGQPVQRDNDIPDAVVMFTVDRYGITFQ